MSKPNVRKRAGKLGQRILSREKSQRRQWGSTLHGKKKTQKKSQEWGRLEKKKLKFIKTDLTAFQAQLLKQGTRQEVTFRPKVPR